MSRVRPGVSDKSASRCETCFGPLEVTYDYARIRAANLRSTIEKRPHNLWRYRELLPVDSTRTTSVGPNSGFTPLLHCKRLGAELGLKHLYIKDDTVNHPTLSYKDRVVSVSITKAREFGFTHRVMRQHRHLATAVAAHAARAGLQLLHLHAHWRGAGKSSAQTIYGAKVITIRGNYDDVNRLCSEIADQVRMGLSSISTSVHFTPRARRPSASKSRSNSAGVCRITSWCQPRAGRFCRRSRRRLGVEGSRADQERRVQDSFRAGCRIPRR